MSSDEYFLSMLSVNICLFQLFLAIAAVFGVALAIAGSYGICLAAGLTFGLTHHGLLFLLLGQYYIN